MKNRRMKGYGRVGIDSHEAVVLFEVETVVADSAATRRVVGTVSLAETDASSVLGNILI